MNPKLHIRIRDGITGFTEVSIDGKKVDNIERIHFDTGHAQSYGGMVLVHFDAFMDIEVEGDAPYTMSTQTIKHGKGKPEVLNA